MSTTVELWIDDRKAIVVAVTDKGEGIRLIISQVEGELRRSGDSPLEGAYDAKQVLANCPQSTLKAYLNLCCDAVIACIRDTESIMVFGPGEAKGELRTRVHESQPQWPHRGHGDY